MEDLFLLNEGVRVSSTSAVVEILPSETPFAHERYTHRWNIRISEIVAINEVKPVFTIVTRNGQLYSFRDHISLNETAISALISRWRDIVAAADVPTKQTP